MEKEEGNNTEETTTMTFHSRVKSNNICLLFDDAYELEFGLCRKGFDIRQFVRQYFEKCCKIFHIFKK